MTWLCSVEGEWFMRGVAFGLAVTTGFFQVVEAWGRWKR